MPRRPCINCGTPTTNPRARCPRCTRPTPTTRGYGHQHRQRTRAAIEAAPWCHTHGGCPHPDAGTPTNPLTGGHPYTKDQCDTHTEWANQPIVPQCARCNYGHKPLPTP